MKKELKKRKPRTFINKKTLAQSIIQNNGLISKIGKQLKVSNSRIKSLINDDSQLTEVLNSTKDIIIDEAESQLLKKIKQGNFQAIKYFLDKQGGSRGYKDKQEIEVSHKGGIVIIPGTINDNWEQSTKPTKQQIEIKTPEKLKGNEKKTKEVKEIIEIETKENL